MQVNMTNRILQMSSIAQQQLHILLFAIFNAWATGYARRLTMLHLAPAEVKASGPIRTSLYEREGSIRPLEATFTEAPKHRSHDTQRLLHAGLKPPNHPFGASKHPVWSLQTPHNSAAQVEIACSRCPIKCNDEYLHIAGFLHVALIVVGLRMKEK